MEAVLFIGIQATGKSSFYLSAGKTPFVADIVYRSVAHKAVNDNYPSRSATIKRH
jgi:hypothetical protein